MSLAIDKQNKPKQNKEQVAKTHQHIERPEKWALVWSTSHIFSKLKHKKKRRKRANDDPSREFLNFSTLLNLPRPPVWTTPADAVTRHMEIYTYIDTNVFRYLVVPTTVDRRWIGVRRPGMTTPTRTSTNASFHFPHSHTFTILSACRSLFASKKKKRIEKKTKKMKKKRQTKFGWLTKL